MFNRVFSTRFITNKLRTKNYQRSFSSFKNICQDIRAEDVVFTTSMFGGIFGSIFGFSSGIYYGIKESNQNKVSLTQKIGKTITNSIIGTFIGTGIGLLSPVIIPVGTICTIEHYVNKKE